MDKPRQSMKHKAQSAVNRAMGFSLVELLVALLFTLLLMAGLGTVFKSSLTAFVSSGENLSNARRNRMSIDLLSEDINLACMYLTDMAMPPQTLATMPPFYVIPNTTIVNGEVGVITDELYFYVDEPLPFEGTLTTATAQLTAAEMVLSGDALADSNSSYVVNCITVDYARLVQNGNVAILKDFWEAIYMTNVSASGANVTFNAGASPNAGITGSGSLGLPAKASHIPGSAVMFVRPAQMTRYRIEMLQLDPNPDMPNGIPCLVRDQGTYALNGLFTPEPALRQIITENVSSFKVYLSVNGGQNWAGEGLTTTGFSAGWDSATGIRGLIDTQLSNGAGRPGYTSTRGHEHWFRDVPTLVRVDLQTRTATRRAEFNKAADARENPQLAHNYIEQSLIFVPRHSGLPLI